MTEAPQVPEAKSLRWRRRLADPRFPAVAALLAAVCALPSLRVGWAQDDYYQRFVLLGKTLQPAVPLSAMDMFRFMDGNPQRTRALMEIGLLPWWTDLEIKARFCRPITVFTHWLDYQVWPNNAVAQHLHSIAWYAALIIAAGWMYRRISGAGWVAGLAVLMYALDDAHAGPVAWLANRNAVVATTFGVITIALHDKWRRDGWRAGALFAPAVFAVALLAKESGLAATAYVFAFALCLDRGSVRSRIASLVPYAAIVVAWRIAWSAANYGVQHLGLYVDPVHSPGAFAIGLTRKLPTLLLGQWTGPPADFTLLMGADGLSAFAIVGAIVVAVLFLGVFMTTLRRSAVARFYAVGMLLSAVPFCSTFPADRLLFFVGLGAFGLLAEVVADVFGAQPKRALAVRAVCVVLLVIHVALAPLLLALRTAYPVGPENFLSKLYVRVPLDDSVRDKSVVVVNPPSGAHASYLPVVNSLEERPVPLHTRVLGSGFQDMTIERTDEHALRLRPARGFFDWVFDGLYRVDDRMPPLGERIELDGFTAEITKLQDNGRPAEVEFRFDVPLDDESLVWVCWNQEAGAFEHCTPPAVGESRTLAGPPPLMGPAD